MNNIPEITVSIIIPTYNRAQFLREAVESVLHQTFEDFEVLVVDDGSTDNTPQLMATFTDPRVRFIRQTNQGRSHARNHALSLAQGRYIAFLDSDDIYLPEKLAWQVAKMDAAPEVGMVYTSAHCIDAQGMLLNEQYIATVSGNIYNSIAFFRPVTITLPTVMVRREILADAGGFDEKMERFEDTDLWRRIAKRNLIYAMPEFTCLLRTHTDNSLVMQSPDKIIHALDYYARKLWREDAERGKGECRRSIAALYSYYAQAFIVHSAWQRQRLHLLRQSAYWWPFAYRHYLYWRWYYFSRSTSIFRWYKRLRISTHIG